MWFVEVFGILKQRNCSVVQVIDDDKGIHIVAAFNLYIMSHNSSDECVVVLKALRNSESDSFVGAASGETFCGVVGAREACQWDITGPAVVRACRCMQEALRQHVPEVIDQSVVNEAHNRSTLTALDQFC